MSDARDHYIVFDGPPGPESGRFVEVENAWGEGLDSSPATWSQREDGLWLLGPFRPVEPTDLVTQCRIVTIRGALDRLTQRMVNDAVADVLRGCPHLRRKFIGIKDYDRFRGQRADHEYGYGPRHGGIVVAVELVPDLRKRDLTDAEKDEAVQFLLGLETAAS